MWGIVKSAYIVLYQIVKVFKFVQLMKYIFSRLGGGGLRQHLWVSPLWFSALHYTYYNSWTVVTRTIYKPKGTYVESKPMVIHKTDTH